MGRYSSASNINFLDTKETQAYTIYKCESGWFGVYKKKRKRENREIRYPSEKQRVIERIVNGHINAL